MKTNAFLFSLLILLILTGCAALRTHPPIIFDETLAEEDMATIYWRGFPNDYNKVHPVLYNGIAVDWKIMPQGINVLKIPGGNTDFALEGYVSRTYYVSGYAVSLFYIYMNAAFSYNFEKGKEYTLLFDIKQMSIYSGQYTFPSSEGEETKNTLLDVFKFPVREDSSSPDRKPMVFNF
jgi:hypothetical protein